MQYTDDYLVGAFERKPHILDIRTKIMLLVMISIFVLGGLGNDIPFLQHVVCIVIFLLMLIAGKIKPVLTYGAIYILAVVLTEFVFPNAKGSHQLFLVALTIIFVKFMPMVFAGAYIISTTTVSEFSAGLKKWHISDKIVVPFCVMFRMFPTIKSEFESINYAMKMRGIQFKLNKIGQFVEFRVVPLIICTVKIGDELSQSAMTRGLGGDINRVCINEVKFNLMDYFMMVLFMVVIILTCLYKANIL